MGEVYRALDTRLGREVAVKIVASHLSPSSEDRARFQREAKTISALNHPHICVLHDIGREGDTDYLVMELVDGETLARRLARGALPTPELLKLGNQIADALDRAHRAGVIHRDLKPGNIMVTKSGAKLMDFGLARAAGHDANVAGDATATVAGGGAESQEPITAKGTVVGTLQYMAPEQLEGLKADARSDIWALGCVLYEMATGKRAFEAKSPASVVAMILRGEPREMSELAPLAPPALDRLVRQCLAKDPDDRWQTAGDLKRALDWISETGSRSGATESVVPVRNTPAIVSLLVTAGVIAVVLAIVLLRPKQVVKPVAFELSPPPKVASVDLPRISPDGRTLAFNATDSAGVSSIWLRDVSSLEARQLPGSDRAPTDVHEAGGRGGGAVPSGRFQLAPSVSYFFLFAGSLRTS
jgi:serine/threonine protein kinase